MKKNISNSVMGLIITLAALAMYFNGSLIENMELKFYDFYSSVKASSSTVPEIALVEINDDSIAKIGRWPWERSKIGEILNWLSSQNAKPAVIGLNILFSEPEDNKSMKLADKVETLYKDLLTQKKIRETGKDSLFTQKLEEFKKESDNDLKLKEAVAASGNVVLPMFFEMNEINSKTADEPEFLKKMAVTINHNSSSNSAPETSGIILPLEILGSTAAAIGHANISPDKDGEMRKHYPFMEYNNNFYPSFAAQIARLYISGDIILKTGESFSLGKKSIPLDSSSAMYISYKKSGPSFRTYSFYDIINNKIVPEAFKGKIVLIGLTAHGIGSFYVTPVNNAMSNLEQTANVVENLVHGRYIYIPDWAYLAEITAILLMGAFAVFGLPFLKAGPGAVVSGILLLLMMGTSFYLFVYKDIWIKMSYPAAVLAASYVFIVTKKFFSTEKRKELIEVSQIETNKMLGLSFQGQGMLDLAFEKFRLCPVDAGMKELLYNLGLDFERKRQFNKAKAVYEHVFEKDPGYKDLKEKIANLTKASDGGVFSSPAGKNKESTILVSGAGATPTLGRYEVLKELGKGAMGIVYLGKDPKINRTVAIKTMRFEEGMDEKEMKALKERFFREAQAAGNLSHPNILKIFDAGEDQDIAYMAMELLKGEDLKKYTRKESLLPVDKVLLYMEQSAEALDYAHKNGVVHRDIKPANIMLLEDGSLRVTDFGIARIQESSKTATGTVLGTPYYMSPEQIAGKKVDGRADIFSLGVTMYELLTGEKPWKGGESVATLFYQITSEAYPDPREYKKDLSGGIAAILEKALKKKPEERYQTAGGMAADIKTLLQKETKGGKEGQETKTETQPKVQPKTVTSPGQNPGTAPQQKPQAAAVPQQKNQAPASTAKPIQTVQNNQPQASLKLSTPPAQKNAPEAKPAEKPSALQQPKPAEIKRQEQQKSAPLTLEPGMVKNDLQIPISEALGQQTENKKEGLEFEKTLPLIYPEDEGGK